jgi:hypothetical protein
MVPSALARVVGFDRNPMLRPVDLLEAWLAVALLLTALVVGPLVAWQAGVTAYRNGVRAAHQDRVRVGATLEADPVSYSGASQFAVSPDPLPVRAHWTAPNGRQRSGEIAVNAGGSAGTVVAIWTDHAGNLVDPPPPAGRTLQRALLAAGLGLLAVVSTTAGGWAVSRRRLYRHRLDLWEAAWAAVEPRWSGRG